MREQQVVPHLLHDPRFVGNRPLTVSYVFENLHVAWRSKGQTFRRSELERRCSSGEAWRLPPSLPGENPDTASRRISEASASGRHGFSSKRSQPEVSARSRSSPIAAPVSRIVRTPLVRRSSRSRRIN